jgi:hypothetical protein
MIDGLYRVETNSICAGFVIEGGRVTACAPILRKRFGYWMQLAVKIGDQGAEKR